MHTSRVHMQARRPSPDQALEDSGRRSTAPATANASSPPQPQPNVPSSDGAAAAASGFRYTSASGVDHPAALRGHRGTFFGSFAPASAARSVDGSAVPPVDAGLR